MRKHAVVVWVAGASLFVSSCGDPCEPEPEPEPVAAFAPFANRVVPRNVDLRVVGAVFDGSTAVLVDPAGVSTRLAWQADDNGWALVRRELAAGSYTLDLYGDGREVVAFTVDDARDDWAPDKPQFNSIDWSTTSNGADDVLLCEKPFESRHVAVSIMAVPDDAAWMRFNGEARPIETDFVATNTGGSFALAFVDFAGNVSDVALNDDGLNKDCSAAPPGLWVLALLLAHRRRR